MNGGVAMWGVLLHHVAHADCWWHLKPQTRNGLIEPDDFAVNSDIILAGQLQLLTGVYGQGTIRMDVCRLFGVEAIVFAGEINVFKAV